MGTFKERNAAHEQQQHSKALNVLPAHVPPSIPCKDLCFALHSEGTQHAEALCTAATWKIWPTTNDATKESSITKTLFQHWMLNSVLCISAWAANLLLGKQRISDPLILFVQCWTLAHKRVNCEYCETQLIKSLTAFSNSISVKRKHFHLLSCLSSLSWSGNTHTAWRKTYMA